MRVRMSPCFWSVSFRARVCSAFEKWSAHLARKTVPIYYCSSSWADLSVYTLPDVRLCLVSVSGAFASCSILCWLQTEMVIEWTFFINLRKENEFTSSVKLVETQRFSKMGHSCLTSYPRTHVHTHTHTRTCKNNAATFAVQKKTNCPSQVMQKSWLQRNCHSQKLLVCLSVKAEISFCEKKMYLACAHQREIAHSDRRHNIDGRESGTSQLV